MPENWNATSCVADKCLSSNDDERGLSRKVAALLSVSIIRAFNIVSPLVAASLCLTLNFISWI